MNKEHIVITGMARTPMGSFQGSLSTEKAPDLGSIAIKGAIKKANIKPEDIDDVVMGCVLPAGMGQAPARQAAINAGIPIDGCVGNFCYQLANPVWPTAFYEVVMSLLIFGILWSIRKQIKVPGVLFSIYLIFNANIDTKIKGERESSFQKRMFDFTQPLFIAVEHPLTGVGLDLFQFQNFRKEFYYTSPIVLGINSFFGVEGKIDVTDKGSSNSVMFLLAGTGFPTFLILMYMLFNQQIIQKKRWLWILILMISVMSEPLLLRPFFFMFILSGSISIFHKITSHKDYLL